MTGRMDEGPFLVNFLPLLGGQKAAVSDSVEGWCAAGNLGASRVSIRMDDRKDGQRDDGTDSGEASFHPDVRSHCPSGFRGSFILPLRYVIMPHPKAFYLENARAIGPYLTCKEVVEFL